MWQTRSLIPSLHRSPARVLLLLGLAWSCPLAGCSSSSSAPPVDEEVRVETARFFPSASVIPIGGKVRWVNFLSRSDANRRTVTSGTGPEDPDAGMLFDVTLEGFGQGEPTGESYTRTFNERGTFNYFTRLPSGAEFTGTVTVQ